MNTYILVNDEKCINLEFLKVVVDTILQPSVIDTSWITIFLDWRSRTKIWHN